MNKLRLVVIAIGVVVALGFLAMGYWNRNHPAIYFVNTSSEKTLTVFVDDAQVATLEVAMKEEEAAVRSASKRVGVGEHTVVAKDGSGKVVDTQKVNIEAGGAFLFAPLHSKDVCWTFQTDVYGNGRAVKPLQPLDPSLSFWRLPSEPNYWFKDTPGSVRVSKRQNSTQKTALRQHECSNPNFEP